MRIYRRFPGISRFVNITVKVVCSKAHLKTHAVYMISCNRNCIKLKHALNIQHNFARKQLNQNACLKDTWLYTNHPNSPCFILLWIMGREIYKTHFLHGVYSAFPTLKITKNASHFRYLHKDSFRVCKDGNAFIMITTFPVITRVHIISLHSRRHRSGRILCISTVR